MFRDLKVLTYRWHCAHQYELWKLGFKVYLWHQPGITLEWEHSSRPLPSNVTIVSPQEAQKMKFDLIILHFDENLLTWDKSNGALHKNWGTPFKLLKELPFPKVAICHGTPPINGRFNIAYPPEKVGYNDQERQDVVNFVGDIPIICNSHQAHKDWRFKKGRVIWHGINPDEFKPIGPKKNEILVIASNMSLRPWYQGYFFAKEALQGLPVALLGKDSTNVFKSISRRGDFKTYVETLAGYSIMVNPTLYSPMPRSRIEAALTGACVVSTNYQDEDLWIRYGETGYYTNDPREMAQILKDLISNPQKAAAVGLRGREAYSKIFHVNRYLADWMIFLNSVL